MDFNEHTAEVFLKAFDKHFWEVWQSVLWAKFRKVTPVRTGQLRDSLVAGRSNDLRYIIAARDSGFYWRFVKGLPEKYQRIYNEELPKMVAYAMQEARRDVGL